MIIREYKISFTTPGFMGNAGQNAQWRTPPIKAQLRQWWRMAYYAKHKTGFSVEAMREKEGHLFGNAWLNNAFNKSLVRIRLDHWNEGKLLKSNWKSLDDVKHPEVTRSMPADIYLGYGPIAIDKKKSTLKNNAAIQAGENNQLSIAAPEDDMLLIEQAIWLMDRYGTLGGRSRNGWGSYMLTGDSPLRSVDAQHNWLTMVDTDWPHAIGQDSKGALIWQTTEHDDWRSLMKQLAELKIALRTHFQFSSGKDAAKPEDRHWLAYPVTNHSVSAWGNNARLPNSLRFKVRQLLNQKLVGIVFHVPHLPPAAFSPDKEVIKRVWAEVHRFLDASATQKLTRIAE